jgi:hypothetical protein
MQIALSLLDWQAARAGTVRARAAVSLITFRRAAAASNRGARVVHGPGADQRWLSRVVGVAAFGSGVSKWPEPAFAFLPVPGWVVHVHRKNHRPAYRHVQAFSRDKEQSTNGRPQDGGSMARRSVWSASDGAADAEGIRRTRAVSECNRVRYESTDGCATKLSEECVTKLMRHESSHLTCA